MSEIIENIGWTDKVWTWPKEAREREATGKWPVGPWDSEPDKVQWVDPETDLDCLIVRNHMGGLCGYVGVGPDHPFSGVHYGACVTEEGCEGGWVDDPDHVHPERALEVHGGLTFSSFCIESDQGEAYGVCHVPEPGRPHKVYWYGFDCGHFQDLQPGMLAFEARMGWGRMEGLTYRDVHYVKGECESLAQQLKAMA